jgi:predicted MFS family arabinose efflux permease
LSLALFVWSALTSASGLARSFVQLALARIGVGVGEAACSPAAHSLLSDLFAPARRATAIALYSVGIYAGTYLAYAVGGWLCEHYDWRTAFVVFGAPGALLALVALVTMREPAREIAGAPPASTADDLRELLSGAAFRHLALGAGIKSIAGYALLNWVPTFLQRVHAMDSAEAGGWLGPIVGLGGALGTFGGGWLADRLGRRAPRLRLESAAWATVAALPFLYGFLFAPEARTALWAYLPASILGAMYLGPVFAFSQEVARPNQRALASAVLLFLINLIGLGLGPWLVGMLNDALAPSRGALAVRWSLAAVSLTYLWGALHLLRAARLSKRGG